MQALATVDPRTLQALASTGMKAEQLIALAFQELAGKADKIGQLNISPDLFGNCWTARPASRGGMRRQGINRKALRAP